MSDMSIVSNFVVDTAISVVAADSRESSSSATPHLCLASNDSSEEIMRRRDLAGHAIMASPTVVNIL